VQGGARGAEPLNSEITPSPPKKKIMSRSPPKSYNGAANGSVAWIVLQVCEIWPIDSQENH